MPVAISKTEHHEIDGRGVAIQRGSDRAFGLTFAALSLGVGLAPRFAGHPPCLAALVVAAALAALAIAAPRLLRAPAALWFRFGLLLHRVTSPVVLAVIYFLVVTPTALILRACGRDLLRLRRDPHAASYWIERAPADGGTAPMQRQF